MIAMSSQMFAQLVSASNREIVLELMIEWYQWCVAARRAMAETKSP